MDVSRVASPAPLGPFDSHAPFAQGGDSETTIVQSLRLAEARELVAFWEHSLEAQGEEGDAPFEVKSKIGSRCVILFMYIYVYIYIDIDIDIDRYIDYIHRDAGGGGRRAF